jgi:hypothetical protein
LPAHSVGGSVRSIRGSARRRVLLLLGIVLLAFAAGALFFLHHETE